MENSIELPIEIKEWLTIAVAGIVAADGIIVRDEMQFVKDFSEKYLENEPELKEKLVSYVIEKKVPDLDDLKLSSAGQLFFIMDLLIQTIYADKIIHLDESRYLIAIGKKLGLTEWDIEERIRIESMLFISGSEFISAELKKWHDRIEVNFLKET